MPPDGLTSFAPAPAARSGLSAGWPAGWQAGLIRLGAAFALQMALFWPEWRAMADQWWNTSTYNHVLLVPVIIGWLVMMRWPQLQKLEPVCWAPGLAVLTAAAGLWLLGAMAGLALISQAGTVAMAMALVPLLLGIRITAGLVFPLFYAVFLVPAGDELIPLLQTITAKLTVALVHLSQVPARIDGVFIYTPAGLFEVAQACSGVKFLTAMIAFGALAAHVSFLSWRRRVPFLVMCAVVPVLANGVRAWGTVYVGQIKGAAYAGSFDHIVYGWVFFAVVIASVIAGAWRFFDRPLDDPMIDAEALAASPVLTRWQAMGLPTGRALAAGAAILLAAFGWVQAADRLRAPLPAQIGLPQVAGWQRAEYAPRIWWEPRATGAERRLLGRYADGMGGVVDVFVALYSSQGPGKKADGFGEGAVPPNKSWAWQGPGASTAQARGDRLLAGGKVARLAQTTYRTGDLVTGNNLALKLVNVQNRVLLQARPTMMLIVSAEERPGHSAQAAIDRFWQAAGPLGDWMDQVARVQ